METSGVDDDVASPRADSGDGAADSVSECADCVD
jgi:hypothetical protein